MTRFALQRKLLGDQRKWRTVVRFAPVDHVRITEAVRLLNGVDVCHWRIVRDDDKQEVIAIWINQMWQATWSKAA